MLKLKSIASGIRHSVDNPSWSRSSGVLQTINSNVENTIPKLCGVGLIQARYKHVMDDPMDAHRTLRFDKKTGLKVSSDIVPKKFFRLRWGAWIRTVGGKNKDLWKKNLDKQRLYQQHVFCKAKQSTLLDKMTTDDYKRPHYYVDDPYEPYHQRPEFLWTRTKPLPPSKNVHQHLDD